MQRRHVLAALLLVPLVPLGALAGSPEDAKRKDKPKPPPPPPESPGKPRGGDKRAPMDGTDNNLTPDGRNYRAPWNRRR